MSDRPTSDRPTPDAKTLAPISRQKTRGRPFGAGNPGRPFPPGQGGRPKGVRNKATTTLAAMFEGEAEKIGRRAVELAKEGQVGAIKLILDRAYPARRGRCLEGLQLPAIASAADAVAAMGAITAALAAGTLSIEEARDLTDILDDFRKMHELVDIERRVVALERKRDQAPKP